MSLLGCRRLAKQNLRLAALIICEGGFPDQIETLRPRLSLELSARRLLFLDFAVLRNRDFLFLDHRELGFLILLLPLPLFHFLDHRELGFLIFLLPLPLFPLQFCHFELL